MTLIERIKERLRKFPQARYSVTPSSITVHAEAKGFAVSAHLVDGSVVVGFDGWHEHFDNEDEALNCFAWGLSDECRLAVVLRGETPVAWTTQHLVDGEWIGDSTTGLLIVPFWRRRHVVYLQNHLLGKAVEHVAEER